MSRRTLLGVGIAGVGAGAYYMYSAGGDPNVAQKKIERKRISLSTLYTCEAQLNTYFR